MNVEDKDDFAAAFADAIAEGKPDDTAGKNTPADETGDTSSSDAALVSAAEPIDETPSEPVKTAEPVIAVVPVKAEPAAAPTVAVDRTEPVESKPAFEEPSFPDPVLTPEQQKVLDQLKKDWPDIAEAQEAKVAHVAAALEAKFSRALVDVVKRMYNDIAPMAGTYAETAQAAFRAKVVAGHSDFDDVQPKLKPWIDQQPGYLKKAYQQAYDGGTAEEIVDLVQRFKDANGVKPQVPDPTPKSVVNDKKVESLTPVSGKRSIVATKGVDPNDYKGAFSEATSSL